MTSQRSESATTVWPGYAAAVWAGLFATVSLYWALGGTVGLDTLGGQLEEQGRSGDPMGRLLAAGATLLKLVGVGFALALVQRWGRVVPRRLMLVVGWAGAALLIGYGGFNMVTGLLVVSGLVDAPADMDWYVLYWYLALWEPIFVVWGVLLGLAVHHHGRRSG